MKRNKIICIVKKCSNKSEKKKQGKVIDPYVLYKLNNNGKNNKRLIKEIAEKITNSTTSKYMKKIIENGEQCHGTRLSMINDGYILSKTSDNLYAIYKEDGTNDLYLLMFIQYDDIKKNLLKLKRK